MSFVRKELINFSVKFNQVEYFFWHRLNQCINIVFLLSNYLFDPVMSH